MKRNHKYKEDVQLTERERQAREILLSAEQDQLKLLAALHVVVLDTRPAFLHERLDRILALIEAKKKRALQIDPRVEEKRVAGWLE